MALNDSGVVSEIELSLAAALVRLYDWQREWFGWESPGAPHVHVQLRPLHGTSLFRPYDWHHRLPWRRTVSKQLLRQAVAVRFNSGPYASVPADALNGWFGDLQAPFDRWFTQQYSSGLSPDDRESTDLYPVDEERRSICCVSLAVFCR